MIRCGGVGAEWGGVGAEWGRMGQVRVPSALGHIYCTEKSLCCKVKLEIFLVQKKSKVLEPQNNMLAKDFQALFYERCEN